MHLTELISVKHKEIFQLLVQHLAPTKMQANYFIRCLFEERMIWSDTGGKNGCLVIIWEPT